MPSLSQSEVAALVRRRHPEWMENQKRWRFLADSYEGGNRYRHADYAGDPTVTGRGSGPGMGVAAYGGVGGAGGSPFGQVDATTGQYAPFGYGQVVDRNLVPHLSEMGQDGSDVYLLRLARTPIPKTMERVIRRHLSRIYAREVTREAGTAITEWWEDVDGLGTSIDKWMRKVVAPLLMVYGNLDLCFDRPMLDPAVNVMTKADEIALGLNNCIASYILPDNMVWWRLDARRRYAECIVLERDDAGFPRYRHWTGEDSTLYAPIDQGMEPVMLPPVPHPYGRPPIVRLFDERKLRSKNTGQPRYEAIAELQKAIYNGLSELILGDVFHSHPLLQGHEKYLQGEDKVSVGPDRVLPTFVSQDGTVVPWSFIDPPQGTADSQRQHILDYGDMADRDAALTKPAGAVTSGTTGQSGISKAFDSQEGNDYLAEVSETLGDAELIIAKYALLVLSGGKPKPADLDAISVVYPKEFDLFTAEDLAGAITDIQGLAASAGQLPQIEGELFDRLIRILLPGLPDDKAKAFRGEIDNLMDGKQEDRIAAREAGADGLMDEDRDQIEGYDNSLTTIAVGTQSTS